MSEATPSAAKTTFLTKPRERRPMRWSGPARAVVLAVVPGAIAGFLSVLFIICLAVGYYLFMPEGSESVRAARALASGVLPEGFFAVSVLTCAFLSGYLGGSHTAVLGLACGATAATTEQSVAAAFEGAVPTEALWYAAIGVCAGLAGGWIGGREAAKSACGAKALYDAMREMGRATDADAIARSLGELLDGTPVGIGIWRRTPPPKDVGMAEGIWMANSGRSFSPHRLLESAGEHLPRSRAGAVSVRALSGRLRTEWEAQGVRSAFVAPLLSSGREYSGLLFVAFSDGSRALRLIAARQARRRLLSAAASADLALEKGESDRRAGIMQERERISREIHDSILQCLVGITLELNNVRRAESLGSPEMTRIHATRASEAAQLATGETRRLLHAMRPEILDGSSLPEALAVAARRTSDGSGIRVACEVAGEIRPLSSETEHAFVRIVQEALSNARKHSGASRVVVTLNYHPDRVVLEVKDNGKGLNSVRKKTAVADHDGGFGLRSMRERMERLDGRLRVEGIDGVGTTIVIEIPTPEDEKR